MHINGGIYGHCLEVVIGEAAFLNSLLSLWAPGEHTMCSTASSPTAHFSCFLVCGIQVPISLMFQFHWRIDHLCCVNHDDVLK